MVPGIRLVQIRNYKSIAAVSVDVGPLTLLVGPNGAGKSNFVDALAFVQDSLASSVELAFKNRGGIGAVRRRSGGHPTNIGIRLVLELEDALHADYSFEIAAKSRERFRIKRERCVVRRFMKPDAEVGFETESGRFRREIPGIRPKLSSDRLALFAASGVEEFRPVFDFLSQMRFYSISPQRLRELQDPDSGDFLKREGGNAAAVLKQLQENDSDAYERIGRLLAKIVDGVSRAEHANLGQKETIRFRQEVAGQKPPWTFDAFNMSDGTLRVLGLLLAIYQTGKAPFVAVEEPESTVHPAAAEILLEVLLDAAKRKQVVLTTHSPDLLDSKFVSEDQLRAVTMRTGITHIGHVSEGSRRALRDRLCSAGELLRANELEPDEATAEQEANQLELFGPPFPNGQMPASDA